MVCGCGRQGPPSPRGPLLQETPFVSRGEAWEALSSFSAGQSCDRIPSSSAASGGHLSMEKPVEMQGRPQEQGRQFSALLRPPQPGPVT